MYNTFQLQKFEEAREISAFHRAFTITQYTERSVEITFTPSSECVSNAKRNKNFDNQFVFDLRLIKVDGSRCCYNEYHSEVGRYYISGQFDYCKLSHTPEKIEFGDIMLNTKKSKCIRIWNKSKLNSANIKYALVSGFEVIPNKFCVPPNTSKKIQISVKPNQVKMKDRIVFQIRNPHDKIDTEGDNNNYIEFTVEISLNVTYHKKHTDVKIESLHKLNEKSHLYTYLGKELDTRLKRREISKKYLQISKSCHTKKSIHETFCTGKDRCYSDVSIKVPTQRPNFCDKPVELITAYDLFDVVFMPFCLNFGKVAISTYGEHEITIKNKTKFAFCVEFLKDNFVLFTPNKNCTYKVNLRGFTEKKIVVHCLGVKEGTFTGNFKYKIAQKYLRNQPYMLEVGDPVLSCYERSLKFGMVTTEGFVTSVPIRVHNHFNLPVTFKWDELLLDTPFEIIPKHGTVPKHSCKICDVLYICKCTKTKMHEVDLISESYNTVTIPIELSLITRKLTIKFLQPAILFKDIPLNIETFEKARLENSSREVAVFYVVEPLIPGFKIEPMAGTIRPKMIVNFQISVKIPCILEFAFDIFVKINNKENVILPVSGNVVEPKIILHPKNIYLSRIPCNMITYIPVVFQNISTLKTNVEVLNMGDDNIFNVYIAVGNERQRIYNFVVEAGQSKTVLIKVYDTFRREYEMYIPFKINDLLGPPSSVSSSTELQYYIGEHEKLYENNPKAKVKPLNKDITYCRITGVITVPWVEFSVDSFEIEYFPNHSNLIEFTMTNISKYFLHVTILTTKLAPHFSLDLSLEENHTVSNDSQLKFELDRGMRAAFVLRFHPKSHGKFTSIAPLYLDKQMTIPYYNLTFTGKRQTPLMFPSPSRLIYAPAYPNQEITQTLTLKLELLSSIEDFSYSTKEEANISVNFTGTKILTVDDITYTLLHVNVKVCSNEPCSRNITLSFSHCCGSYSDVEVSFTFTYCPLTLHSRLYVSPEENPYPFYPLKEQKEFYEYMETCTIFLEKWMFQQGFRRDLFPVIPDTFHAISSSISSQAGTKSKGINVSYLNFIKRIAGPLMKHIRKVVATGMDESFKYVKEIHDTYREIIILLRSRGANLWDLKAKFLLSYEQFVIYSNNIASKANADIILSQELISDINLFNRLNKQSWIDFILQSYKVFVMDSCFFECVCISCQPRDVLKILIDWLNDNIAHQHTALRGKGKPVRVINNITTDLTDGIAFISSIMNYCPFLNNHFALFCDIDETDEEGMIINNACLIIEAINVLRLYFPISSKDFLQPNFLLMLFFSIDLYVTLPMFKPRDTVEFNPPILRTSTRQLAISPTSQESLTFYHIILNNTRNNFNVEKVAASENGKKMFLSVKYTANFVQKERAILLVHGYNKTRIFDTYIVFILHGNAGLLNPLRKCRVTGHLYRPSRVDFLVSSPFQVNATFKLFLTDVEPTLPWEFQEEVKPRFYLRRLTLIDKEVSLSGLPKETGQDVQEQKVYLQLICLSTQVGNSWIWFRSEVGEFFIKITTQARWDLAIDTLQSKVQTWPLDPCSCGEACMLLDEGGTNTSELLHILRGENTYRISSKSLIPRIERATLSQHTNAILPIQVTIPAHDTLEKYSFTLTSDCGMDIRTYRIIFIEPMNSE
ncbi:unnamed protein product [Leptidea sinapis]|uniref:Cilia- and flagella-associated protein 47 domain-containing protein n=1 Tax=Leptidea sinapis TaxID=189913 RepID=A0A5E4QX35_9NEOP|nr:unnamed protein product [Leptidea sinapis]